MIDENEFRAFMTLMNLAGQDRNEEIVCAINGLSETEPKEGATHPLERWIELCRVIDERADARGYDRGKNEVSVLAPPPAPLASEGEALTEAERATLRTWKSARVRGGREVVPDVVKREVKRIAAQGHGHLKRAMDRFNLTYPAAKEIADEGQREAAYRANKETLSSNGAMPDWAVEQ